MLDEYDRFVSLDNFKLAWERIKKSDRLEVKDRMWIDVYNAQIEEHLTILINRIDENEYSPSKPSFVFKPKRRYLERPFSYLSMDDRIVYQALGNILVENSFLDLWEYGNKSLFAHLPQKPDENGMFPDFMLMPMKRKANFLGQYNKFQQSLNDIRARLMLESNEWWEIVTDVASYYPSISHTLLLDKLLYHNWLNNPSLISLLSNLMGTFSFASLTHRSSSGIPIGYETSDILGTLFLFETQNEFLDYHLHSYVDDVHMFVPSRADALDVLHEFDLWLQSNALVLAGDKTQVVKCEDVHFEERKWFLSFNLYDRKSEEELHSSINSQLLIQLKDMFDSIDEPCNEEIILNNDSRIAYILYRLEEVNDFALDVAICLLKLEPRWSVNAVKYLENFAHNDYVLGFLQDTALSKKSPRRVRLDCILALVRLLPPTPELVQFLLSCIRSDSDWFIAYQCLNLLRETPELAQYVKIDDVRSIFQLSQDDNVAAISVFLAFELADQQTAIKIINYAIERGTTTGLDRFVYLALFLWRRNASISRSEIKLSGLKTEYTQLFLDQKEQQIEKDLHRVIQYFEILLDNTFQFSILFDDIGKLHQYALDIDDSFNGNARRYFVAVELFLIELAYLLLKQSESEKVDRGNLSLFVLSDGKFVSSVPKMAVKPLLNVVKKRQNGQRLTHRDVNNTHIFIKHILSVLLNEVCVVNDLKPSFSLRRAYSEAVQMRDGVFISYSSKDAKWRDIVKVRLEGSLKNTSIWYFDDTQIPIGHDWDKAIKSALNKSKVVIMLVTPEFAASNYIVSNELHPTLKAVINDGVRLYWVAVSYADFGNLGLLPRQCVNDPDKPLDSLPEHEYNRILVDMAKTIRSEFP